MSRNNKVQPCIFCGEVPCACDGPVKQKPAPKRRVEQPAGLENRVASFIDEVAVWQPPAETKASRFSKVEHETVKTEDDYILEEAVRNLEPILSDSDKKKLAHILKPAIPTGVERQLLEWRRRNGKE